MPFTADNTEGFTTAELAAMNAELAQRLAELGLEEGTEDYAQAENSISDEISNRA